MKKLLFPSILLSCYFILNSFMNNSAVFQVHNQKNDFFTNGAPASRTGAPGEANCTGCHLGTANDGTTTSSISFSGNNNEYQAGQTYNMSLSISNGSNKNGFQIVAFDANNSNAGSLTVTDPTNTSIVTGSGNTYINQTSSGTSQTTWSFDWVAPSSNVGPVTFYYAYNVTNSNNGGDGDQIYLAQQTIQPFVDPTGISPSPYETLSESFNVNYSRELNQLLLTFTSQNQSPYGIVKLYSINGKFIFSNDFAVGFGDNNEIINLQESLSKGVYLVSLFLDNNVVSKKIIVN